MKKILALLLACLILLAPAALAIDVYVDGEKLVTDTEPVITGGRTIVPVRPIFEALGATIQWNGVERSVTATKGNVTVYLKIDDTTAYVNGEPKVLDVSAMIMNNRTMVPARFVAEALNATVKWDGETKTVNITSPSAETSTPPEDNQSSVVYITPSGKRYHESLSCAGKNGTASTVEAAVARGLTPCKTCAR